MYDYDLIIIPLFAEILFSDEVDRVKELRLQALMQLRGRLDFYKQNHMLDKLVYAVAEKRSALIMKASTKAEMERAMSLNMPHYDGNKFVTNEYHVPEEELIGWALITPNNRPTELGQRRYMELFAEFFPEESKELKFGGAV